MDPLAATGELADQALLRRPGPLLCHHAHR
jgi:hypothetical protein